MKTYYDRRAAEYDDWWYGRGRFANRERPGWRAESEELIATLSSLAPARTLDVACGTGFLTRFLPGTVVGLDQSERMLEIARQRVPSASFVRGEALRLPFGDGAFDRVFSGHFYGHLEGSDRERFLEEARRVAAELVVVDSALRDEVEPEEVQERFLDDGSRWEVYKRYFTASGLAAELGGGETLHAGRWFVAIRAR
jgi:demethylmenaquinone methyltransferase/2-methoxy-6-polyprenyl-1,4-benzoquinol methylase